MRHAATKRSLSGVCVLVGRARHQAGALSAELRKLGADVLEIPFIEIRKPRSFRPLDSALKNIASYDWLILTSVNGVDAMWERMTQLALPARAGAGRGAERVHHTNALTGGGLTNALKGRGFSRAAKGAFPVAALAAEGRLSIAAIGPATKKAIEQRGVRVNVVPEEYVAESVVESLRGRVEGKRVLLVRAKVARDVIPRELRKAGAQIDVVEAYETLVPEKSRQRLAAAFKNPARRPQVITFTSSSTVRNFVDLLGGSRAAARALQARGRGRPRHTSLASIGPVTSSTLRELGLPVDIQADEFTIPGLVRAIVSAVGRANCR